MLVPAVNVPPVFVVVPPILNVLELPSSVPVVLVHAPVNTCVKPAPRSSVPAPVSANAAPLTLPRNVAVPEAFDIVTGPVVVKPAMEFAARVPEIVTPPEPEYVPPLVKSQLARVNKKVLIANVPPPLI